jgi:hypothetical protein
VLLSIKKKKRKIKGKWEVYSFKKNFNKSNNLLILKIKGKLEKKKKFFFFNLKK